MANGPLLQTSGASPPPAEARVTPLSLLEETPGRRPLAWLIGLLLGAVFVTDLLTREYLHVGVLYNVCIALTLWSWRPRWVVQVTTTTVLLRLVRHVLRPALALEEPIEVEIFNLAVGISVQALTGALIWRQVWVQHRLEAKEKQTQAQALALADALAQSQEATERERAARLREVEARRRERHTLRALERVKDLSAALNRAVLPEVPPEIAGGRMRLCARYAPAERDIQIGGDFYDILTLDESQTRFGLVIGDVAGHGVEAAAQTALVTSTLRTCVFEDQEGPASVLSRAARILEGQLESFVSLVYGVFDAADGSFTYAGAGHEPPILAAPGLPPAALRPTGPILGVGLSEYHEVRLILNAGETLIFLTDGLTEVRRETGEMLEWEGVAEIAGRQAARSDDAACIADGLLQEVRAWAGKSQLTDDVALLVARVV